MTHQRRYSDVMSVSAAAAGSNDAVVGFCHFSVDIRASARAGVSGTERERAGVSRSEQK